MPRRTDNELVSLDDPRYARLGKALAEARRDAGLTQVEAAAKLGITQSTISKWERGERRFDMIEMVELCRAYGTDAGLLLPIARGVERKLSGGS